MALKGQLQENNNVNVGVFPQIVHQVEAIRTCPIKILTPAPNLGVSIVGDPPNWLRPSFWLRVKTSTKPAGITSKKDSSSHLPSLDPEIQSSSFGAMTMT